MLSIVSDHSKIIPSTKVANVGDNVHFKCESYGGHAKWSAWFKTHLDHLNSYKRPSPFHNNTRIIGNFLQFKNVQVINHGYYQCQGVLEEQYPYSLMKVRFTAVASLVVC